MDKSDKKFFDQLKKAVCETLQTAHPHVSREIHQWKKKEIELFQNDLLAKVSGRISEKWFYTHMKSENEALPRIDILDLLSQYVGATNWDSFKGHNKKQHPKRRQLILLLLLPLPILTILLLMSSGPKKYTVRFVDPYSKNPVTDNIEAILLRANESPLSLTSDNDGNYSIETEQTKITIVVNSPYYMPDTLRRNLIQGETLETVTLRSNDYALILHLFTNEKLADWSERKAFLDQMFLDNAKIYQIIDNGQFAMAIYNKDEFIRKLMLPTGSLKNLEILETTYHQDRIAILRFKQVSHEKD